MIWPLGQFFSTESATFHLAARVYARALVLSCIHPHLPVKTNKQLRARDNDMGRRSSRR